MTDETQVSAPVEPLNAEPISNDPLPETAPVPAHPTGVILTGGQIQEPTGAVYEGPEIDEDYEDEPAEEEELTFEEQIEPDDVPNGGE